MKFNINSILRENIKNLVPYSSARNEYSGESDVLLDANENSFGSPLSQNFNRYPDPLQVQVKKKLSQIKNTPVENIFLGNGSDEAIDILFRAFCIPNKDNVIICPPTYGMYEVSANINDIKIVKVPLTKDTFQLDTNGIAKATNKNTKLIFICCPNNPTGNGVKWDTIKHILKTFAGIIVVDEAYIDFANYRSLITELNNYPNLVIIQTLSKAWGLAGLRIGIAFAPKEIIEVFNKIKPPYNINSVSQKLVLEALNNTEQIGNWVKQIVKSREALIKELTKLKFVTQAYTSQANFILVKIANATQVYNYLISNKIVVRNRSKVELCEGCLRFTIGTPAENKTLLTALKNYSN